MLGVGGGQDPDTGRRAQPGQGQDRCLGAGDGQEVVGVVIGSGRRFQSILVLRQP